MSIILRVGAVKPLRGQETHYGSGDEAGASYTDADVLDIPLPEHTYQRPLPAVFSQPQSNTSYFGLPYQDHNYGLPPPQSPPRPRTPEPPSPLQVNGVVQMEEEVKTSPLVSVVEEVVEDSITRCICGYLHDDGYMICCDKCSVWQHIDCMGVDRNNIPDNYFCELCQPRVLDAVKAKLLQKRKREELAARNVLSDSSATDTDPEEAANALASMVKKLPVQKRKGFKQKRSAKPKEKSPLKLKIGKTGGVPPKKLKKPGKKEKENIKAIKSKKVFKPGVRKLKDMKCRPLMTAEQSNTDPWDSTGSPWADEYEFIQENFYSDDVMILSRDTTQLFRSEKVPVFSPHRLTVQSVSVAEVKKNRKGLKAVEQILAGQGILEYTGRVMLKHEYDQHHSLYKPTAVLQPFVLFHSLLDIVFCVDATACGNEARFIRRSCTPNAEVQLQYVEEKIHFVILAKKDINLGVEVTISFDYDYHNSSTCIECACLRINCDISKFWKKKKKLQQKELTGRRRRQSSEGGGKRSQEVQQKATSPHASPRKVGSPGKASDILPASSSPTKITSPIRLSVSTLLAASALLDAQSESTTDVKLNENDNLKVLSPPLKQTSPLPKSNATQRRASKSLDLEPKEEKFTLNCPENLSQPKEKVSKPKEIKHKPKETKETLAPVPVEVKKERRLSSRRQSQEELLEESPAKEEVFHGQDEKEDIAAQESYRKMTREERKLDAIMKAFEKMEKREERRKEAVARGEGTTKKGSEQKGKKNNDEETDCRSRSVSQDGAVDEIKIEDEEQDPKCSNTSIDVKEEPSTTPSPVEESSDVEMKEVQPVKEEPVTQKLPRKLGKRKRRRSRVQTAPPVADTTPVCEEESISIAAVPPVLPPLPPTPASAPVPLTVNPNEAEEKYIYIKSKKNLFNEWSHKHEDESSKQEEVFVECLPSPRVNAMDHLQRRNSHSAGCNKASESGGGFAKKRWLRQAMHEEPTPVTISHSLSVSTDNGSASPINGSISPSNGVNLSSPGASSPIDFVTPLKKRRLMRESLLAEGNSSRSPSHGVMSEAVDVVPKSNGLKSFLPPHRHSVDDRLLLHKNYPHQNGFREVTKPHSTGLYKKTANSTPSSVSVCLNFDSVQSKSEDSETPYLLSNGLNHKVPVVSTAESCINHLVNGFSSASDCITSVSLSPSGGTQVVSYRASHERMETDSSYEVTSDTESHEKLVNSGEKVCSLNSPNSSNKHEKEEEKDGSSSSHRIVVNSVYKSVNNLMESSSETAYVVTKSIMDANGPATVCVDLNVHEMEPSLTGGCKTVVDLDKELFVLDSDSRKEQCPESPNECQVNNCEKNSSNVVPLGEQDHSLSSCDIVGTNPPNPQFCPDKHDKGLPSTGNVEDKTENENSEQQCSNAEVEMCIEEPTEEPTLVSTVAEEKSPDMACTSSKNSTAVVSRTRTAECDSVEADKNASENESVEMPVSISSNDGMSTTCDCDSGGGNSTEFDQTEPADKLVEAQNQSCDSAGNDLTVGLDSSEMQAANDITPAPEPGVVSDSSSVQELNLHLDETNVDSTSSEPMQGQFSFSQSVKNTQQASQSVSNFCDSNSERDLPGRVVECDNSISMYDSSSEEVGVSSSSALFHTRSAKEETMTWDGEECTEAVVREAVPDNAVCAMPPSPTSASGYKSPATSVGTSETALNSSTFESHSEPCSSSMCTSNANGSRSNSAVVSSNTLSTPPSHSSSSLSSPPLAGTSQEESTASNLVSTSASTSDQEMTPPAASVSPSTSEAVPAVKKKVSLLEYRMRLKKPASATSEIKMSSPVSQPCTTVTLSSVCERFLSSSPSSTSTVSHSASSSSPHRKQRMPTLATLPLFKSAEKKREEKKPREKKVEKQLSLSERLRLEFGVDVSVDDNKSSSETADVDSSTSRDDGIPPPPPPPLPPSRLHPYSSSKIVSRPTSTFSASSTIPGVNYIAPLVNGGISSGHNLPQQATVSSTSVSSSQAREGSNLNYPPPPPPLPPSSSAIILGYQSATQQQQPQATVSIPLSPSSSSHKPPSSSSPWVNRVTSPLYPPGASNPQPCSTNSLPPQAHHLYEYHIPPSQSTPSSTASGNTITDDNPPPPPPHPPPIPWNHLHQSSSTSSSSSSHRHSSSSHRRYDSSDRNKKAASSSTHHYDKRTRY